MMPPRHRTPWQRWRSAWRRWSLWTLLVVLVVSMLVTLVWLAGRYEASQVQSRLERDAADAGSDIRSALSRNVQSLQALQAGDPGLLAWEVNAAELLRQVSLKPFHRSRAVVRHPVGWPPAHAALEIGEQMVHLPQQGNALRPRPRRANWAEHAQAPQNVHSRHKCNGATLFCLGTPGLSTTLPADPPYGSEASASPPTAPRHGRCCFLKTTSSTQRKAGAIHRKGCATITERKQSW